MDNARNGEFMLFLLGIFLVAFGALTYEVALSYEFAYIFWFNASIAILSTAMLGLGIGGVAGYFLSRGGTQKYFGTLHYSAMLFGIFILISLFLIAYGSRLGIEELFASSTLKTVAPITYFALCAALPFIFAGIALSVGLNYPAKDKKAISYIYFSDLVGAGIGAFAIAGLLRFISLEACFLVCSAAALLASLMFLEERSTKKAAPVAVAFLAIVGIFYFYPASLLSEPNDSKFLARSLADGSTLVSSTWDPVSRIDVVTRGSRYWLIENGVTPVEVSHGNVEATGLRNDPRFFMFDVFDKPPESMLAIGAGGGIELTMALAAGVTDITAVEINPAVIEYMENDFREYSRGLFFDPRIETVLEDGRTYTHRTDEKFDLIENGVVGGVGLVVPSSRVLNFVYTYVFTKEANSEYLERLSDDGSVVTIIYVLLDDYNSVDAQKGVSYHLLRQFSTTRQALGEAGLEADKHIMIFLFHPEGGPGPDLYQGEYTFVFKRELTEEKTLELIKKAEKYGLEPAFAYYYPDSLDLDAYSREIPAGRTVESVVDERPFFFHTEDGPPGILYQLVFVLGAITVLFIIMPVAGVRGYHLGRAENYLFLVYFLCLGAGFILIEAVLIQKLTLFLGRPAYAFQVVLFSMLIWSGCGSYLTSRVSDRGLFRVTPKVVMAVFILALLYGYFTSDVIYGFMGNGIPQKIAISAAFLAPLSLFMGMPFPMGLRITSRFSENDVVWMYALNSAGSVLGSLFGMIIAFMYGYSAAIYAGGAGYLVAFAMLKAAGRRGRE